MNQKTFGITVLGDFIVSEGVTQVVRNLLRVGATAVATNPTVTARCADGDGSFQPPADAGSSPRRFDRPLFGEHALWVRGGPSFRPHEDLYANCKYGPRQVNDLTKMNGPIIGRFVAEAKAAGLDVHLQVGAAQPTGLLDEDRPRLPDGTIAPNRMADTASLAAPDVRDYNAAYLRDLLTHYPAIDAIRIDWPEYPCYTFGELFQDFSSHVQDWCTHHDFDFDVIRMNVERYRRYLASELRSDHLLDYRAILSADWLCATLPPLGEWLRLKAALSTDLISDWRRIVDEFGEGRVKLVAHAFMPPWSRATGFNFAAASRFAHSVAPKLYTMHWPLMVDFWSKAMVAENSHVSEAFVVEAVATLMQLGSSAEIKQRLESYVYPGPEDAHPVPQDVQLANFHAACGQVGNSSPVVPIVHGYGPLDDFAERLQLAVDHSADGVWINRYGYLSDAKLERVRDVWRAS